MFLLRDLVSPRTWLAMTSHLAGLFTGMLVMVVVVTGLSLGFSLVVLALAGLPLLGLILRFADWFAVAERARIGLMLGARIPVWPAGSRAGYRWYVVPRWRTLTQRATWGEIGYALLRLPVSAVALTLSVSAWSAALVLLTLPLYNKYLPSGGAAFGDTVLKGTPTMTASVVVGLIVLLIAPQVTRGFGLMDAKLSRWLLGPPSDLAAQVTELEISRERVVGAAEAERRRIERDLHDGAQQRLVALAMELGRAKAKFADDPDAARVLVDQAHSPGTVQYSLVHPNFTVIGTAVNLDCRIPSGNCGLNATLDVPADTPVDLASGGGNVQASGIQRDVTLDTAGGDVTLSGVGGNTDLSTGGGNVNAGDLGGIMNFTTDGGDVTVNDLFSPHVKLETGGGNVTLTFTKAPAYLNITSDGGDITVVVPHSTTTQYAISYDTGGGDYSASVPVNLAATAHTITVASGGGNVNISEAS